MNSNKTQDSDSTDLPGKVAIVLILNSSCLLVTPEVYQVSSRLLDSSEVD